MSAYLVTIKSLDERVAKTTFGRVFRLEGSGHVCFFSNLRDFTDIAQPQERRGSTFFTELRAGLTTFFTMSYIIAVNVSSLRTKLSPELTE